MLGKLMKHEFRATQRIMLPILAAELLLSVFAGFSIRGLNAMPGANDSVFLRAMYFLSLTLFFLGMFAIAVTALVLMIQRFYRSLLCDEGYLSMTLPVSADEQIFSKLLVSFVWFFAVGLLYFLAMLVVMSIGGLLSRPDAVGFSEVWEAFCRQIGLIGGGNLALFFLEGLVLSFLASCAVCLRCYSAMAIGCSAANHKLALSFLTFVLIGVGLSIIRNLLFFGILPGIDGSVFFAELDSASQFHGLVWIMILAYAAYNAVFYFVTRYFLKNKLNLA